ncbi:MAG: hypothetical protein M1826_001430 [Phylliscum demangeonii]|nr:MAG: hypothetical protein M1826_001430 [Phylliscum demangeonii]
MRLLPFGLLAMEVVAGTVAVALPAPNLLPAYPPPASDSQGGGGGGGGGGRGTRHSSLHLHDPSQAKNNWLWMPVTAVGAGTALYAGWKQVRKFMNMNGHDPNKHSEDDDPDEPPRSGNRKPPDRPKKGGGDGDKSGKERWTEEKVSVVADCKSLESNLKRQDGQKVDPKAIERMCADHYDRRRGQRTPDSTLAEVVSRAQSKAGHAAEREWSQVGGRVQRLERLAGPVAGRLESALGRLDRVRLGRGRPVWRMMHEG